MYTQQQVVLKGSAINNRKTYFPFWNPTPFLYFWGNELGMKLRFKYGVNLIQVNLKRIRTNQMNCEVSKLKAKPILLLMEASKFSQ